MYVFEAVRKFPMTAFVTELYTKKLYVYGVVPPERYDENVSYDCPASTAVFDTAMAKAPKAGLTVAIEETALFAVINAESVTMTFE